MPNETNKLVMTFEANTIKHLGVQMYSTIPPALAEIIANAYDACATEVFIKLYDNDEKKIVVMDNGTGMTFSEVNDHFLRIGRNRRDEHQKSSCGRIPTGKKGLGKLALFGIGDTITIETIKNKEKVLFTLNWNEIQNWQGSNYEPKYSLTKTKSNEKTGTKITLSDLKRKSGFSVSEYAVSLSKLFNFLGDEFKVFISLNDGNLILIDNKLKYESIDPEFTWDISDINKINVEYSEKNAIKGTIISSLKPLSPGVRGITLFANGRMVNFPEFFGQSESSHFYSYITGWLDVDFLDNWKEDVISTNRQTVDWEHEKTIPLREYLASCLILIEKDWREKRKHKKRVDVEKKTKINISSWYSTLPQNIQEDVELIVNIFNDSPEISEETQQKAVERIHQLIPEYPNFHWRHLHDQVKDASSKDYQAKDFYRAFEESMKRYISITRKKSASVNNTDSGMMGEVFGKGKTLITSKKYKKPDGTNFSTSTLENIEEGQKFLSMGILAGARNPVAHEEVVHLRESELFSEKDCLDFLSLLSHLFKRLEDSEL